MDIAEARILALGEPLRFFFQGQSLRILHLRVKLVHHVIDFKEERLGSVLELFVQNCLVAKWLSIFSALEELQRFDLIVLLLDILQEVLHVHFWVDEEPAITTCRKVNFHSRHVNHVLKLHGWDDRIRLLGHCREHFPLST